MFGLLYWRRPQHVGESATPDSKEKKSQSNPNKYSLPCPHPLLVRSGHVESTGDMLLLLLLSSH